ncbi:MAG TPA: 5-deoxy-glucuronate isomerase [Chloroflexia bacterium]|nr:5-deoxy-glucuronate isomerase [Chloroflexia bacterium]
MTAQVQEKEAKFFETIGNENGFNGVKDNSCELLDFGYLKLNAREDYAAISGENEVVAVILGGKCTIQASDITFEKIGQRPDVFGGKPYAVYIPASTDFSVTGPDSGKVEVALCYAKARSDLSGGKPFLIRPEQVESGTWGAANFSRTFHSVLVETDEPVHRLIVGETYTPSGHWSTYPPHKHEQEIPGQEVFMEEFYFFKSSAPEGWGLLKHYTEDRSIDNVYTVKDNTLFKASRGYHTYVEAPGYTGYYLWFLAGNHRNQNPKVDPDLAWVGKTVPMLKQLGH